MKSVNTIEEEQSEIIEVTMPGSLRSIIKEIVGSDNAARTERFDPEDQADDLANRHFERISNHPEFQHEWVRKAIRQTSGNMAGNGAKMLSKAFDPETGLITLLVTENMTICVNDENVDRYIPLRHAGTQDLLSCLNRIWTKADVAMRMANNMKATVDALVKAISENGAASLGEILNSEGIFELQN